MGEREILFKGKRMDNGEWVEGIYCPYNWNMFFKRLEIPQIIILSDNKEIDGFWCEVIPSTVGQYTGLTDKNGVKIFEGDIIRFKNNIGYVIYTDDDASFLVDSPNRYIAMDYSNEFEIIGNIHDNPELMKGGADNDR